MKSDHSSAIARLVARHNGASALSRALGGRPVYQEIQRWVKRGWASPMHIFRLEPYLLAGMSLHDLHADRLKAIDPCRREAA
jgi:hypothetical protein